MFPTCHNIIESFRSAEAENFRTAQITSEYFPSLNNTYGRYNISFRILLYLLIQMMESRSIIIHGNYYPFSVNVTLQGNVFARLCCNFAGTHWRLLK